MDELSELEALGARKRPEPANPPPPGKRPRAAVDASQQAAALLAAAEAEAAGLDVDALDDNSLKRLILHVEKQINTNMQLRMKYSDQPERFMDSELELYQSLKGLHAVAAAPELYPIFVKTKCMTSLLGLLAHENADIANDALELLQEMAGAEDAAPEDLLCLVDALLEHDGAATLAHNLARLNDAEEDEAQAVHSTLTIFEAVLEARPEAAEAPPWDPTSSPPPEPDPTSSP
jgi:beta-catenin-like protein 1